MIAGASKLCTETTTIALSLVPGHGQLGQAMSSAVVSRYAYALCRGTRGYDPVSTCNKETPLINLFLLQNLRSYYAIG